MARRIPARRYRRRAGPPARARVTVVRPGAPAASRPVATRTAHRTGASVLSYLVLVVVSPSPSSSTTSTASTTPPTPSRRRWRRGRSGRSTRSLMAATFNFVGRVRRDGGRQDDRLGPRRRADDDPAVVVAALLGGDRLEPDHLAARASQLEQPCPDRRPAGRDARGRRGRRVQRRTASSARSSLPLVTSPLVGFIGAFVPDDRPVLDLPAGQPAPR